MGLEILPEATLDVTDADYNPVSWLSDTNLSKQTFAIDHLNTLEQDVLPVFFRSGFLTKSYSPNARHDWYCNSDDTRSICTMDRLSSD